MQQRLQWWSSLAVSTLLTLSREFYFGKTALKVTRMNFHGKSFHSPRVKWNNKWCGSKVEVHECFLCSSRLVLASCVCVCVPFARCFTRGTILPRGAFIFHFTASSSPLLHVLNMWQLSGDVTVHHMLTLNLGPPWMLFLWTEFECNFELSANV